MGIGFRISLVMLLLLLVNGSIGVWYYRDSQAKMALLIADNAKLETAVKEQEDAISSMKQHAEEQAKQVQELQTGLNAANDDKISLEKTLRDHDLAALARKNPKLLEDKMNKATDRVWRDLEVTTGAVLPPESTAAKSTKKSHFKKL